MKNDILRTITAIAACATVLMMLDESPTWINIVVVCISCAWLILFFHANARYFARRQLYSYYQGVYPGKNFTLWKILLVRNKKQDLIPCDDPDLYV